MPIFPPKPEVRPNPMVDAAAQAICRAGHAQVNESSCFDGDGGVDYGLRLEPCVACRVQAFAAIAAFIERAKVEGMRHGELSDSDQAAMAELFERIDRKAAA